jgi:hypothetical protein
MKNNGTKYQKRFLMKATKNFIEMQNSVDKDGLIT